MGSVAEEHDATGLERISHSEAGLSKKRGGNSKRQTSDVAAAVSNLTTHYVLSHFSFKGLTVAL